VVFQLGTVLEKSAIGILKSNAERLTSKLGSISLRSTPNDAIVGRILLVSSCPEVSDIFR